jgi:hypothetical protein
MDTSIALYFRDEFRQARAVAFRDAESFEEVIFILERMGSYLNKGVGNGLGDYKDILKKEAAKSPLACDISSGNREYHTPFAELFDLVKNARNSALHEGSFARHLTTHTIELSLIMEDALMHKSILVSDFMVRDPVCAHPWQPFSFIRQKMLVNSFSYLPVYADYCGEKAWWLISDYALANYLREAPSNNKRKKHLATHLSTALKNNTIKLDKPYMCGPDNSIDDIMQHVGSSPILVRSDASDPSDLLGILTAFDLL